MELPTNKQNNKMYIGKIKNKKEAIKQAREEIGEIFAFGDGYKFLWFDDMTQSHREAGPYPYQVCKMHRSESLIEVARGAMGLDPYIYYDGGSWIDYLA